MKRISRSKAATLWNRAENAQLLRTHEKFVLESLTVDDAAAQLSTRSRSHPELDKYSPIGVLASILIRERMKRYAATLFVRTVVQDQPCEWQEGDGVDVERFEEEERTIVAAAKSLGGRTGELGEMLERVWKVDAHSLEDVDRAFESLDGGGKEGDSEAEGIKALLKAVVLYRRIFPSSVSRSNGASNGTCILLSPPPSPSRKNSQMHLALRRILGSSIFDCSDFVAEKATSDDQCEHLAVALDEARDQVVDMLMDLERQFRGYPKMGDAV